MMEGLQKQGHALLYVNLRQDDDIHSFQTVTEDDMHAMR